MGLSLVYVGLKVPPGSGRVDPPIDRDGGTRRPRTTFPFVYTYGGGPFVVGIRNVYKGNPTSK